MLRAKWEIWHSRQFNNVYSSTNVIIYKFKKDPQRTWLDVKYAYYFSDVGVEGKYHLGDHDLDENLALK
jgi:hypothetical protein